MKEQDRATEESELGVPVESLKGSERFTFKEGFTWALGSGALCAVFLYGSGEALVALRSAGVIGMAPMSEAGVQSYRIALGILSIGAAVYGWFAAKESYE